MFGNKWEPATATIIVKQFKTGSMESGSVFTYVADIQRDSGGAPFRTELHEPTMKSSFRAPSEGATVRALADPKHDKAKFDTSDPKLSIKTQFAKDKSQFDQALASAPGTPLHAGSDTNEDPRLALMRANLELAQMRGNTAEVERLTEIIRKIQAGELPQPH